MSDDVIRISGIRAWGRHGVLPEERTNGQPFVVDVALHVDLTTAGHSDALDDTVDYSVVARQVASHISGRPHLLIEALAHAIAEEILAENPSVSAVDVVVHKPHAPIAVPFDDVTVEIRRVRFS